MSDSELDLQARKQLLLTRIAMERAQWSRDVVLVRTASRPRQMLKGAVRSVLPNTWGNSLFRTSGRSNRSVFSDVGNGVMQAVMIARRYPVVVSVIGAVLARRTIRRVLVAGTVSAAVAGCVWFFWFKRPRS